MIKSQLFLLVFFIVLPIFCLLFLFFIPNFYTDFFGEPAIPVQYCQLGQFWGGQNCVNCSQVENGYCNCKTFQGCNDYVCQPGYMKIGNLSNPQCEQCPKGCIFCGMINDAIQCLECDLKYQLIGNICVERGNCLYFSNTTGVCQYCVNDTYQNIDSLEKQNQSDYYNYIQTQCTTCKIDNCLSCQSSNICQQCNNGYFWKDQKCLKCNIENCKTCINGVSTCTECNIGYYLYNNQICLPCNSAISNCSTCVNTTNGLICQSCDNNCTLVNSNIEQNVCQDCKIYTLDNNTIISNDGCTECLGPNNCIACLNEYTLYRMRCFLCPEGCDVYQGGCTYNNPDYGVIQCNQCLPGYYLIQQKYSKYLEQTTCIRCNETWLQCSDQYTPTQCVENYFLYTNSSGSYCIIEQQNNYCQTISDGNNTICASCLYQYTTGIPLCYPCQIGCIECQYNFNQLTCSICQDGYFLQNQECFICSDGCQNCITSTSCSTCLSGYYLNQENYCTSCFSGCQKCINNTACLQCQTGYYQIIQNNIIISCSLCEANCYNCTNSGSTCTVCNEGFIIQNGQCQPQEIQNCYTCNSTGCTSCQYGYYLSNQTCLQCIDPYNNFVCRSNQINILPTVGE